MSIMKKVLLMPIMKKKVAKKAEPKEEKPVKKEKPAKEFHANKADISVDKGIIVHCDEGDVIFKPRFFNQVVYEYMKQKGGNL